MSTVDNKCTGACKKGEVDSSAFFRLAFRNGVTPEKLYSLALDELNKVQKEEEAAKAAEAKKKLDTARDALISALVDYAKISNPGSLDGIEADFAKIAEASIKAVEEGYAKGQKVTVSSESADGGSRSTSTRAVTRGTDTDTDKIIAEFVKKFF